MTQSQKVRRSRNKGGELLSYLGASLAAGLEREGLIPHRASEIALDVMASLRFEFAGQLIYFPRGIQERAEEKAEAIYQKYQAGTAIDDLAHEYGHSVQWVYRLIASVRKKRQSQLKTARYAGRS